MEWMKVRNKTPTSADLYFYGEIVSDSVDAWTKEDQYPENVRHILQEVKDIQQLNIYINSPGGSVFAALAIYNMLKRHPARKTVYVDALIELVQNLIDTLPNKVQIKGHSEMPGYSWKACPVIDMDTIRADIEREEVEKLQLADYQWRMLEEIIPILPLKNKEWLKKVEKRELTTSELAWLCLIVWNRK